MGRPKAFTLQSSSLPYCSPLVEKGSVLVFRHAKERKGGLLAQHPAPALPFVQLLARKKSADRRTEISKSGDGIPHFSLRR